VSKSSSIKRHISLLFVFVVSVALVGADLVVLAQNGNTQDDQTRGGMMTTNTQNSNTTTNRGRRGRRRRGNRSNSNTATDASVNMNASTGDTSATMNATVQDNGNMSGSGAVTTGRRRRRRGRRGGAAATATTATTTAGAGVTMTGSDAGTQTDLSGTYTGTVDYPEGGLTGDATLTISGNNFTLTAGSTTQAGRITAVTTRGYVAVTMMFGDLTPPPAGQPPPPPLPAVSLRGRMTGKGITLTSVPGEKRQFKFTITGGSVGTRGRRRRRG
jgi:hypothetical protein